MSIALQVNELVLSNDVCMENVNMYGLILLLKTWMTCQVILVILESRQFVIP